jgi:sodium/hydrogen antiporter
MSGRLYPAVTVPRPHVEQLVSTIALVGGVIIIASLLSGIVESSGVPLVATFLALGVLLGPHVLGVADIGLDSPQLATLATLGLTLVLFSDAVALELAEVRRRAQLTWRLLGPGTLAVAVVVGAAAWLLLGVSPAAAALLGAALAATDPVLLRNAMRSRDLPESTRMALRLETGMNDVVVLPIVIFSILALRGGAEGAPTTGEVLRHALGLLLLGPAAGAAIGSLGILALKVVRGRFGVRRDYESLYALGLAFTAYAAAEALGGSGFLAAFAAGLTVAWQDVELCDCFLEYGEATAEMLLLLTFVALGLSLIWTGLSVIDGRTLLFAGIALFARTLTLLPLLRGVGLDTHERRLIALFGPRGLSSLLYVLLAVFAGVGGAAHLFTVTCLVVLLSIVVHGGGMTMFLRARRAAAARTAPAGDPVAVGPLSPLAAESAPPVPEIPEQIGIAEVRELQARGEPVVMIDARTNRSFGADPRQAAGAVRLPPSDPERAAMELRLTHHGTLVVYCA